MPFISGKFRISSDVAQESKPNPIRALFEVLLGAGLDCLVLGGRFPSPVYGSPSAAGPVVDVQRMPQKEELG